MSPASVVVVGGGLAGLACAWRLRRAGHEVEVLERDAEPGGRWRAEAWEGFLLERRAPLCWGGDATSRATTRALGLDARWKPLGAPRVALLAQGRLRSFSLEGAGSPPAWLASLPPRAALALLRDAGWRARRLRPLRPESALRFDDETLADWGRRVLGDAAFDGAVAPLAALGLGAQPGEVSRGHALLQLRRLRSRGAPLALEGGANALLDALGQRVPVRTGCEVLDVATGTAGARVRYRSRGRERSVLADAAVLAVPAGEVLRLAPRLTPAERDFFQGLEAAPQLEAHLLLDRAPPGIRHYMVLIPEASGDGWLRLEAAHLRPGLAPAGAGLLRVRPSPAARARWNGASDDAVLEGLRRELAALPGGVPPVRRARLWRDPVGEPRFAPGALRRLARFRARAERSPRLAFTGGGLLGPGLEAALACGGRAATEVARGL